MASCYRQLSHPVELVGPPGRYLQPSSLASIDNVAWTPGAAILPFEYHLWKIVAQLRQVGRSH